MCEEKTEKQRMTAKRHKIVFDRYFELRKQVKKEKPLEYDFLPDTYFAKRLSLDEDIAYTPQTISKIIALMIRRK